MNLPIVVWGCQIGYPDPCQSKPTRIKAGPHASEATHTRHRPAHTHLKPTHTRQNPPTIVNAEPSRVRAYPPASDPALASAAFTCVALMQRHSSASTSTPVSAHARHTRQHPRASTPTRVSRRRAFLRRSVSAPMRPHSPGSPNASVQRVRPRASVLHAVTIPV